MNPVLLEAWVDAWLTLAGLLLGSFLGVVADRVPRGESALRGRSFCRACGRRLGFLDLVPVVGYLVRRGRCASCGASIPWVYPALELGCGAAMLVPALFWGPWPGALVGLVAVAAAGTALTLRAAGSRS